MIPDQQSYARSCGNDGTLDGHGAADHDQPYRFGRKPSSTQPFPFSTHEYVRLLILRSRIRASHQQPSTAAATPPYSRVS
jgi:hypothetical protein